MYRDQYGEFVSGYRGLTGGRGVMAHNVQWGAGGEQSNCLTKKAYYEQVTQDQWNSKVQSQFIHS